MRNLILSILFFALMAQGTMAQTLPDEWSFSPDGRRLVIGAQPNTDFYDSSAIRNVYLNFPQTNYWSLLTSNYASKTLIPATMLIDNVTYDSVGVRFRGNTSYQGTGSSQKKSFSISLDYIHSNQKINGYKTLHFNNSYQDRSILREVFYSHQIKKHIPTAKANFIHLYLNNLDWGIYPNVQKLNGDFIEEWFLSNNGINWRADRPAGNGGGWGDGTAALNYLGMDTNTYKTYYTLKSSDLAQPWDKLVTVCSTLNNSGANLSANLPAVMDVDRTLWFLACEIAFTDDDSYVMKGKMDYHLWYESETGRTVPIEYDGNSVMVTADATTWSPFYNETKVNYPLLNKVLAVPAWRQRYLAHMRTIIKESLDTTTCIAMLNNYKNQIDALVSSDPKKLYTYNNFVSEVTVLKNFVKNRRNYLLNNAEVAQVAPTIVNVNYTNSLGQLWTTPAASQPAQVTTHVVSSNGIDHVTLYYSNDLVGNFTPVAMFDDGLHNDSASADGIFGASIPGQAAGTWVRFYVEAAAGNTAKSVSFMPVGAEHDVYYYNVAPVAAPSKPVAINEVMASNTTYLQDNAGDFDDWIELHNLTSQPVNIGGYFLTDNIANLDKWEIPVGTTIPANGYYTVWADEDSSQGVNHCNFKLSASGEFVYLLNASKELVDSVVFGQQTADSSYSRIPNGTGPFVIKNPTYGVSNLTPADVPAVGGTRGEMVVYPNPATMLVNIKIEGVDARQVLEFRNISGQLVHRQQAQSLNSISTANWASGMYYIRYGDTTLKLIVVH